MTIHCRDFERAWNEKLDARGAWPAEQDGELERHAAGCPRCQPVDARYRALAKAIGTLGRLPAASPGFADGVLAAAARSPAPPRIFRLITRRRLAAAAAVLAAGIGIGTWLLRPEPRAVVDASGPAVAAADDDLGAALADATSATLSLAKEASAPAARVGRDVLAVAEIPATGPAPSLEVTGGVLPTTSVWESVEERVNAGVRPISGTARSAFGFLLGAPAGPAPGAPPAAPRGA